MIINRVGMNGGLDFEINDKYIVIWNLTVYTRIFICGLQSADWFSVDAGSVSTRNKPNFCLTQEINNSGVVQVKLTSGFGMLSSYAIINIFIYSCF